ncbi:hypothetical protein N9W14_02440 [Amylibacter sp.]|nr:hypothetical protein [Amylibacter sp.]
MRCLAFANQICLRGWSVYFSIRLPNIKIVKLIEESGHDVKLLKSEPKQHTEPNQLLEYSHWLPVSQDDDALETVEVMGNLNFDWVLVDHYALDQVWHKLVQKKCNNIAVIDDLADRKFDCSIIVNQNLGCKVLKQVDKHMPVTEDCLDLIK